MFEVPSPLLQKGPLSFHREGYTFSETLGAKKKVEKGGDDQERLLVYGSGRM